MLPQVTKGENILKSESHGNLEKSFSEKTKKHIDIMRSNIDRLMEEHDYTIKELAEKSDIEFSSLRTFLYDKDAKDCRLTTALKLAKAFNITIAELVGSDTVSERLLSSLHIYRSLPESSKRFIDWILDYQKFVTEQHSDEKFINVMLPICASNGNLKKTNDYIQVDIQNTGKELIHRVFMGIKIPCHHYLPHYFKGDILLIANDRQPLKGENTVVIINGNIVITRRSVENGEVRYYGVRDGIYRSGDADNVYLMGYIAHVISSNE